MLLIAYAHMSIEWIVYEVASLLNFEDKLERLYRFFKKSTCSEIESLNAFCEFLQSACLHDFQEKRFRWYCFSVGVVFELVTRIRVPKLPSINRTMISRGRFKFTAPEQTKYTKSGICLWPQIKFKQLNLKQPTLYKSNTPLN